MGAKHRKAVAGSRIILCVAAALPVLFCLWAAAVPALNAGADPVSVEARVVPMSLAGEAGALSSEGQAERAEEEGELVLDWIEVTGQAPWVRRSSHTSVVFGNSIWVIGGADCNMEDTPSGVPSGCVSRVPLGDVWSSADGMVWSEVTTSAPWGPRCGHTSVVFDDRMWVIGGLADDGYKNDVWCSSDGAVWLEVTAAAPWSPRCYHTSVVFQEKMWVLAGQSDGACENDVWHSADGVVWTEVAVSAGWSARSRHTSVIYNDMIWVIGGSICYVSRTNEVWHSLDGAVWEEATEAAPWSARYGHASVVLDSRLWVVAGLWCNDLWYSCNGVTWTQATAHAPWLGRVSCTATVFDGGIWLMGGYLTDLFYLGVPLAEIWRTAWGPFHSADPGHDNALSLSELLRVVQLYQSATYHCDAAGEDGYAPEAGVQDCQPHSSDYHPQDWSIDLSELLRVIQFYNSGGYHPCPDAATEDGFCPGEAGGEM